eukprot:m.47758 g.47758  ORF g.47758 m.47758 type:complete len:89 (+) comp7357_c0_seq1:287-553(+)
MTNIFEKDKGQALEVKTIEEPHSQLEKRSILEEFDTSVDSVNEEEFDLGGESTDNLSGDGFMNLDEIADEAADLNDSMMTETCLDTMF